MSNLRSIFLAISNMPPAVMLLIIIGLAITITTWTSSLHESQIAANVHQSQTAEDSQSGATKISSDRPHKKVVFTLSYLPANNVIESKQITVRDIDALEIWDDAELTTADVIGKIPTHSIPANIQIRKGDLP